MNLNKFISIARMTTEELCDAMYDFLSAHYGEVYRECNDHYMFARGHSSVCLVAHLDTVLPVPPQKFYRTHMNKNIIMGAAGLGADDRAGVYAIMEIVNQGLRPSIIFTTGEESGGEGAFKLIADFKTCPVGSSCLIELDRQGKDESVYYNSGNQEFEKFINSFGFKTHNGIFSDISILAAPWDIAAVNLSIGYTNEHTLREKLNCQHLEITIQKTISIICSEPEYFDYQEDADLTFWRGCFICTTGDCNNCLRLIIHKSKGGSQWPRRAQ